MQFLDLCKVLKKKGQSFENVCKLLKKTVNKFFALSCTAYELYFLALYCICFILCKTKLNTLAQAPIL